MRYMVIGSGMMGSAATYDLLRDKETELVLVIDAYRPSLERLRSRVEDERLQILEADALKPGVLEEITETYNIRTVVNAVPHHVSEKLVGIQAELGLNVADMSFEETQLANNSRAVETGASIVVGIGVAPGISDILLARHMSDLERVEDALIYVGGIVENPESPLLHRILFNAESLWNEYVRPARIIENGKQRIVEALSGLEIIGVEGIGVLEAFYTDGYRSVLKLLEKRGVRVKRGFEKTLRLPGHAEKVRLLRDLGLLDTKPLTEHGCSLRPRDILNITAQQHLAFRWGIDRDIMILITIVSGMKGEDKVTRKCMLIDRYDERAGHTAMARTTAYTAAIVARMLAEGGIKEKGVILPGELGYNKSYYDKLVNELEARGVTIECSEKH